MSLPAAMAAPFVSGPPPPGGLGRVAAKAGGTAVYLSDYRAPLVRVTSVRGRLGVKNHHNSILNGVPHIDDVTGAA